MASGNNTGKGGIDAAFFTNILKWVFMIMIAIFFVPWLVRYLRKQMTKDTNSRIEAEIKDRKLHNKDEGWSTNKALELGLDPQWLTVTRSIAHNLGTMYPWWNPRSWTENDDAVLADLQYPASFGDQKFGELNLPAMLTVEALYHNIVVPGESLENDLRRLLPSKDFNGINFDTVGNYQVPTLEY